MNLLFCTLSYFPGITGGAERQARLQAEELVRRGHSVTVVCARTDGLRSGHINGVRIIRLRRIRRRPFFRISYMVRLLLWLLRHGGEYDLAHVHVANLQADIGVALAHLHGAPAYVKVACGGAVGEVQRFRPMARLTRWYGLRHADRVQVLSDEIGAELTMIGVAETRMVRIPNGIDLREFQPLPRAHRQRLREHLGLPEDAVIVLFLGRLVGYKGVQDVVDAWTRVSHADAQLVIVGATEEQHVAGALGAVVRGWAQSPVEYFQAADVFVHPSHADGMSNAVLEAMACGCALVATEHGATSRLLTAGHDALLVPVAAPRDLGAAISRLVTDEEFRLRLAQSARATIANYDIGGVVDCIEGEYRTLLGRGSSDVKPGSSMAHDPPPAVGETARIANSVTEPVPSGESRTRVET